MKYFLILLFTILQVTTAFSIDYVKTENVIKESDRKKYKDYESNYDDFYRLTKDGTNQIGALWIKNPVDLSEPFIIEFSANFGFNENGADGIALVFHKDPRPLGSVIGQYGSRIGYGGFTGETPVENSVALEFDTYYNPPLVSDLPNGKDHFDILRNGDILNSTIPIVDLDQIEDNSKKQIQVVWVPSQQQPNIGTLTVMYECGVIFQDNNFQIDLNLNWNNTLDDVYVGLTAATGDNVNYHRVRLILPELELKAELLCGNVQLEASFPTFCNTYKYEWTAADGSTDGLINPNTINPIAYKTGTYTCTVTEINSSYTWSAHIDAILDNSINVGVGVPNYSFSKTYNNQLNLNNTLVSVDDGVCGTQLAYDCGYLISAWSELKLDQNFSNGAGMWLIKTDYLGDIDFSKYFISTNGLDLSTVTEVSQKENYKFHTISHYILNDFKITWTEGNDCTLPLDSKILPDKKHIGYFISGETKKYFSEDETHNIFEEPSDILFAKVDKQGDLVNSVALDYSSGYDYSVKTFQTENDRYISLNQHRNIGSDIRGSLIGLCYTKGTDINSFNLLNQFGFTQINNFILYFENSDFISIPKISTSVIAEDYLNIIALPCKLSGTSDYGIAVLKMDDVFKSSSSNILLAQKSVSSGIDIPNDNKAKVLFSNKEPSVFYVVTKRRIHKFDINLTLLSTELIIYPTGFDVQYLSDAVLINSSTNDKIEMMVSGSGTKEGQIILSYDLNTKQILSAIRYNYTYNYPLSQSFDNLNSINNGLAFAGIDIDLQNNNDVIFTSHNYNYSDCIINEIVTTQNEIQNLNPTPVANIVDINTTAYDPGLVEIEHSPEEKGYECIDADFCECEDIDENSIEIYTVAKPRDFDNSDCCFDVYVKNTGDCKLLGYEFSITQSEYGQIKDLPANKTIVFIQVNTSVKLGEICLADGVDDVEISVSLRKSGEIEYCKDENQDPLVFKTSVTCFEGCCDYIKVNFLPVDPDGNNCCWLPNIISTNPLCDVSDVVIEYYDLQSNRINLNNDGELCVDPSVDEISFIVRVGDEVCNTLRTRKLECDMCDCPDDFIKSSWLKVEANKDSPLCPAGQCATKVSLDIAPEYLSCFTHYNLTYILKDKDGTIIGSSDYFPTQQVIPTSGIIPNVPPCINEGEKLSVRVRLYSNSTTSDYCELNSPEVICDRIDNIHRPAPCDVNTPEEVWSDEKSVSITLPNPNGCEYKIRYVYRINSQGFQDVQMTYLEKVDKNCLPNIDDADVFRAALPIVIAEVLSDEPDWKPRNDNENNCTNIWRVIQKSCWVKFFGVDAEGEFTVKRECESDCCARHLRVCIDENNKVTVEDIGFAFNSSTFNCSVQPIPNVDTPNNYTSNTGCQDFDCDVFKDFNGHADQPYDSREQNLDLIYPKEIIKGNRIDKNKSLLLYQVINTNDLFQIIVEKSNFESLDIDIYNINGEVLISKRFNNFYSGSELNLSLKSLTSGTYFVKINANDGIEATHTIQIVR